MRSSASCASCGKASLAARRRADKPAKLPSRTTLADDRREPDRGAVSESPGLATHWSAKASIISSAIRSTRRCENSSNRWSGSCNSSRAKMPPATSSASRRWRSCAISPAACPRSARCLETDIYAAYEGDPAARSVDEVLACYPGITAIAHHRLAHALYALGAVLVARIIAEIAHSLTGIDIHPGAQIKGSFFIDHGTGVVIGETAVIGEHVRLYHGVTLGAKAFSGRRRRSLVKGNPRHPIVEDDVVIYAGATILGASRSVAARSSAATSG